MRIDSFEQFGFAIPGLKTEAWGTQQCWLVREGTSGR
jgi:hypothetical protein